MTRHQDTPDFKCGVPIIDRLYELMTAYDNAEGEVVRVDEWMVRCVEEIQPTKWTQAIERAIGDEAKLTCVRVEFDEKLINFLAVNNFLDARRSIAYDAGTALRDAVTEAVELHNGMVSTSPDVWQKPMLRAAIVAAVELLDGRQRNQRREWPETYSHLQRAEPIVREAYKAFVAGFDKHRAGYGQYPTDCAVQGRKYLAHLNPDVDLRTTIISAFRDREGRYPANRALIGAVEQLEAAVRAIWDRRSNFRSYRAEEKGSVNEAQHAGRLIEMLHGHTCGKLDKKVVEEQNQRRIRYELMLRKQGVVIHSVKAIYADTVKALAAAIAEAEAANLNPQGHCMVTSDWKDASRRILTNLLAADAAIRRWGRAIAEIERESTGNDLSHGAGSRAVEDAFEGASKRFKKSESGPQHVDF